MPDEQAKKVRVVVTDMSGRDPSQTTEIEDDYIVIVAGSAYVAGVQSYGNGTHVITVKGRRARVSNISQLRRPKDTNRDLMEALRDSLPPLVQGPVVQTVPFMCDCICHVAIGSPRETAPTLSDCIHCQVFG